MISSHAARPVELRAASAFATIALALSISLVLTGCGATSPTSAPPAPTPATGGENLVPQVLGHAWRADVSRDARLWLYAGADESAIVDASTDAVLAIAPGCTNDAAFAPDGRHAVLLTCSGAVRAWDLARDAVVDIPGNAAPDRLERGGPFILASRDDGVEIVHLGARRRTPIDVGDGKVRKAYALASGGVAVLQKDGALRVFRATGAEVSSTKLDVRGAALTDDGTHSLLLLTDRDATVVDVQTGYVVGRGTPCDGRIIAGAFTAGGARVAIDCSDGEVGLFSLDLTRASPNDAEARAALAATPARAAERSERAAEIRVARGGKLYVTTPDPFVVDTSTGAVTRRSALGESAAAFDVRSEPAEGWALHVDAVEGPRRVQLAHTGCAVVSADGAIAASVIPVQHGDDPAQVRIDRLREPGAFDVLETSESLGGCSLALSSDGRFLLAGRAVFDSRSRRQTWAMSADDATLTFLPGGARAFANVPGRSRIVDVESGVELRILENMAVLHGSSDDGRFLVVSRDRTLVLVDADTGRVDQLPFAALHQVVWVSPRGAILWIGTNAGLEAYRVADGARIRWIGGAGPVTDALGFDPDAADDLPFRVRRGSNILAAKLEPLRASSPLAHPRLYADFVAGLPIYPAR